MSLRSAPDDRVRAALRSCRRHLLAAALFSALVNLLYIAPTLYMLQVYDRVVPTHGLQTLGFLTLVLLFALASLALLDRVRTRLLVRAGVQLNRELAPAVLDASFSRTESAEAHQALRHFDHLRGALGGPAALALFDAPWLPIYILACILVHPWIGAVALLGCLLLPLVAWLNERATRARLDRAQQVSTLSHLHQDAAIAGAEAVRALGMRRALVARQMRQRTAMLSEQSEAGFAAGNYVTLTKFTRLALQSLALGLGALLASDRLISAGAIFASSFLIARALAPIEQLVAHWRTIAAARQAWQALNSMLSAAPASADAHTALPAPSGALGIDNLVILNARRDAPVLQGVTLDIAAGEVVAIIGPSGAGKSTLARALAGAILPDRGTIRLDGADMRDWDPERLAPHIGYLPQLPTLLAGSIAENIARFAGENGMEREVLDAAVVAAAQTVGAHETILDLPGGYDHRLPLGGGGLSGGQAQKVALARAVFGDPALLILDEPNAHLDAEGDAQLVETLAALKRAGKTILIISHKMSILPVVDRILVLREGRPALFGPRQDVMTKLSPPGARPAVAPARGSATAEAGKERAPGRERPSGAPAKSQRAGVRIGVAVGSRQDAGGIGEAGSDDARRGEGDRQSDRQAAQADDRGQSEREGAS